MQQLRRVGSGRLVLAIAVLCAIAAGLVLGWVRSERPEGAGGVGGRSSQGGFSCRDRQQSTVAVLTDVAQRAMGPQDAPLSNHLSCEDASAIYPTVTATVRRWTRRPDCIGWLTHQGWRPYGPARVVDSTRTYVAQCVVDDSDPAWKILVIFSERKSLPPVTGP